MTTRQSSEPLSVDTGGAKGVRGPGAGGGGAVRVFRWLLRQLGVLTLGFLAVFAVCIIVMDIMFARFHVLEAGETLAYAEILPNASAIFLFVLGIIMPLYLELLLSQGSTRRQYALGLLGASATIACVLALINCVVALVIAEPTVFSALQWFFSNWFFFLVGWLSVIGYQYRHVATGIASTLVGLLLFSGWPFWVNWGFFAGVESDTVSILVFNAIPASFATALSIAACLILALVVFTLTRRIPIKV